MRRIKINRSYLVAGALVLIAAAIAALFFRSPVFDVEIAVVDRGPMQVTVDDDGVTRVRHHAEVSAPVSGRMRESRVEVGDTVSAGSVLAYMTPAPLDPRERDQARAAASAAAAVVAEAEQRVRQADVALAEARRARARAELLHKTSVVSTRDLELAQDSERLREQDLAAAKARVEAASQDERRARLALVSSDPTTTTTDGRVVLRAPIAGRVLRLFEEHDRVIPAGTQIAEIGDPRNLEIVVDVLTRDAGDIVPGAPMSVRVAGRRAVPARVTRVEPSAFTKVSPLGVEEQRVNIIGQFLEPITSAGDHFEVDASIVVWQGEDVVRMPTGALVPMGSGWGTFVVTGGRANLRPVGVGRRGTRSVEVKSGVSPGDSVVVLPDDRLRSGSKVRRVATAAGG